LLGFFVFFFFLFFVPAPRREELFRRAVQLSKTKPTQAQEAQAEHELNSVIQELSREIPEAEVKNLVVYGCISSNEADALSTIFEIVRDVHGADDIRHHKKYKEKVQVVLEKVAKALLDDVKKETVKQAKEEAFKSLTPAELLEFHMQHLDPTGLFSLFHIVANSDGDPKKFVEAAAKAILIKSIVASIVHGALILACTIM